MRTVIFLVIEIRTYNQAHESLEIPFHYVVYHRQPQRRCSKQYSLVTPFYFRQCNIMNGFHSLLLRNDSSSTLNHTADVKEIYVYVLLNACLTIVKYIEIRRSTCM